VVLPAKLKRACYFKSLAGGCCIGHELDGCRVCCFKRVRGSRCICHELDFAWVIIGVVVDVELDDVGYVCKVVSDALFVETCGQRGEGVAYPLVVSTCGEEGDVKLGVGGDNSGAKSPCLPRGKRTPGSLAYRAGRRFQFRCRRVREDRV